MSLTSTFFLTLVIVVTIAAFVLVVVLWPRLSGPTPGKVAGRVGLMLLVNALVILTAATQLNATYLFFADWTDLQGALTGQMTQTAVNRGTTALAATRIPVKGEAARAPATLSIPPVHDFNADGVGTFTVRGRLSGVVGNVSIRLPPGYGTQRNAMKRYPVLEAFPGYPGSPYQWLSPADMNLPGVMSTEVGQRHMRSALLVLPETEIPPGVDTECVNGRPGSPQLETWLTRDVPDWVAQHFRVSTRRSSWATIGLSSGGWCAAMAALLHPAQYGAAIVLGGYFRPELSPFYEPYPPRSPLVARYDLPARVKHGPPPVAIWLETSHVDSVSYRSSASFLKAAGPPLSVHALVLAHAGHRMSVWEALLPQSLAWLGAAMPGFR